MCEPSCVVAVIVAEPAATPETNPEAFTVATAGLFELQLTFLFVALAGAVVAASCLVVLITIEKLEGDTLTPVTGILNTVIEAVAVCAPFCVVTVIVALPGDTPVTKPDPSTLATEALLELQLTVLMVAFAGATVAVSCCVAPTLNDAVSGETVTPVTGTMDEVTVTSAVAVKLPSTEVTVIVEVPMVSAITTPFVLTVATAVLLDEYVTDLLLAFEGVTAGVSCRVAPPVSEKVVGVTLMPVTGTTTQVSDSVSRLSK